MRLFFILALPLYLLDQATKFAILARFKPPREIESGGQMLTFTDAHTVIPGFFDLVRVHNTGVAFGSFNGGAYSNYIFGAISALALGAIIWLWKSGMLASRLSRIACTLLVSGILGNLTDRFMHGYVVDFLDFQFNGWHWPSFNVADSCITIAAALLIIDSFRNPNPGAPSASKEDGTAGSSDS
jgi:signal peptidase II